MRFVTAIICFFLPAKFFAWLLNLLGHQVSSRSRIGFTVILTPGKIILEQGSAIGSFNLIQVNNLALREGGRIGRFNKLKGPVDVNLQEKAAIGNSNRIYRAPIGVTYGHSELALGKLTKITGNHRIDCTRSVVFGDYSILAGHDSQLWTHGYYHDKSGPGRFRLDGEIKIGNNVYIGSRCVITAGIEIADAVVVGANVCVSKSLLTQGTYVSQPLRLIEAKPDQDPRLRFRKVEGFDLCEEVYESTDRR